MDVAYYLILWAKLGKAACLSGPLYHHDQIGTVCSRCATFPSSMEAISAEDNFYLSASFQAKWFCIKFRHCCLLLNGFLIPLLANEWAYAQLTLSIQQMWNKKLFKNQWNKIAQKLQEITRPKAPKLFFIWNQKSILALLNGYTVKPVTLPALGYSTPSNTSRTSWFQNHSIIRPQVLPAFAQYMTILG